MANFLLIESRDPFESRDVPYYYQLASDLAEKGEHVTLFLVQNGVLATRRSAAENPLINLLERNVRVVADGFSLRERGIEGGETFEAVDVGDVEELVDISMSESGTKVMWH